MRVQKLLLAFSEALTIYGLVIFVYGILAIHVTRTWSGDWPVDRNIPWLTLDVFIMVSFEFSFLALWLGEGRVTPLAYFMGFCQLPLSPIK
ncbi:MAG: hypothetical protein ACPLKQ_07905 [Candidatus Bathyarchaeales archaeon]